MSAAHGSTLRFLTALTAILLTAGLLSAAHADRTGGATRSLAVTTDGALALPVEIPRPPTEGTRQEALTPPAPLPAPEPAAPAAAAVAPVPAPAAAAAAPAPAPPRAPAEAPEQPAPAPVAPAAPPARPAPAPAPAPRQDRPPAQEPAAPAQAQSDEERLGRAYTSAVPAAWRSAITAVFEVIPGSTSWASSTGRISIARDHTATPELLADVVGHEFGHLIAFRYGSQAYAGAPPAGWPAPAERPEEAWADCVQRVFLGRGNPSHGLSPCDGDQLRAAHDWIAQGPASHERTG